MSTSRNPLHHPDRSTSTARTRLALTGSVAVAAGISGQAAAQGQLSASMGLWAGVVVAVLAMVGLPSLSIRVVARVLLGVSATVLVRFGVLAGGVSTGGQFIVLWIVAAVAVLVLSDRVSVSPEAREPPPIGPPGAGRPSRATAASGADVGSGRRAGDVARTIVIVSTVVVVFALAAGPTLLPFQARATEAGEGASLGPLSGEGSALRASNSLDMTRRPALTDEIVFTVESNRATFWRGQTFDRWDGRTWTRSDERFEPLLPGDGLRIADDDLGARGDDVVRQRFRMEASYADVVYAAPSAVDVEIDRPVRQRADGTLVTVPLGRGAAYSVTSRREPTSEERLRSLDPADVPDRVREQYAQPPEATDRVLAAAAEVTEGIDGHYEQILALQEWMGSRVEYSLDAPLAPRDQDVVDHFLFDAEQGWCEQVASSLVVLARANGIPARLVTGFVPAERDPVTGTFTVRARDAHAWTEVWFPEVGWVSFDPTANVPLAGEDAPSPTLGRWLIDRAILLAAGVAVLVLLGGPVRRFAVRRWRRWRAPSPGWATVAEQGLDALGTRIERPRLEHETASTYAAALARRYGEPRLSAVGAAVDGALYAPTEPDAAERAELDRVVASLLDAPVPPALDEDLAPSSA